LKKGLVLIVTLGLLFIPLAAYGIPSSIGIVADGIKWTNGVLTPYEVNSNGIAGGVQINSISTNPPKPGASLQLNAILHVTTTNGTADYFIQNLLQIDNTNDQTANFENNVWSLSKPVNSSGICEVGNQPCYPYLNDRYYAKSTGLFTYQLPFSTSLVMTEDVDPDHLVEISFMHIEHGNTQLYDHYYLPIPNVKSASFLINEHPSSQTYYAAALVWAGYGNGSSAYFDSMDSILNLQYEDTNSNTWKPFPSYSSNGYVSTAETAQNIYSTIEPNSPGQALVKLGNIANQNNLQTSTVNEPQTNQPISNTPINQQSYSSVSISTNMNAYLPGDSIVITGRVPVSGIPLSIQVLDPSNHLVKLDQVNVNSDGRYGTIISAGGPAWSTNGTYTIQAKGSPNISAQTTFQFGGFTNVPLRNTIPEFGTFTSIVFLIGIITTMVISARVRRFSKINYLSRQM